MQFKQTVLVAALAAASLSLPALAADYHYGDVTGISVADTIYVDAFGPFLDNHFFTITTPANGFGVISNIKFAPLLDIFGLSVDLWMDNGTTVGAWDASDTYWTFVGAGDLISASGTYPVAGNYFMQITGSASGTGFNLDPSDPGEEFGAYYFNASTVPVPEAETWAMMAVGLGLVGLQLRRRTRRNTNIVAG